MKPAGQKFPWYVYIVRCNDGTLYTGITTDLEGRMVSHNSGKGGAKYTKARRPVVLVYAEGAESRSEASKREYRIKQMPLTAKWGMVAGWKRCPGPYS
ncbi:MAG: GIY-YIG nuclease family protein [Pseudomonadota bacterium]